MFVSPLSQHSNDWWRWLNLHTFCCIFRFMQHQILFWIQECKVHGLTETLGGDDVLFWKNRMLRHQSQTHKVTLHCDILCCDSPLQWVGWSAGDPLQQWLLARNPPQKQLLVCFSDQSPSKIAATLLEELKDLLEEGGESLPSSDIKWTTTNISLGAVQRVHISWLVKHAAAQATR